MRRAGPTTRGFHLLAERPVHDPVLGAQYPDHPRTTVAVFSALHLRLVSVAADLPFGMLASSSQWAEDWKFQRVSQRALQRLES